VIGDEIKEDPSLVRRPGYRLTGECVKEGIAWPSRVMERFNHRKLHQIMGETVYCNLGIWGCYLVLLVLAVFSGEVAS